jgi:pimeloyl-ACP methyl ester carboxylesterase
MWIGQVGPFSEQYRVIVPDLRGHGKTTAPADPADYGIARYAEDVRELLDHLEIRLCALVGCSFGGMIALQFATTYPERVAALVISDSSPAYDHPGYDEGFRERERRMREQEELVRRGGTAALAKQAAATVGDGELAEALRQRYLRMSSDGFLGAALTRRTRPDLTPLLQERLTMPVLLCGGDDDPVSCALPVMQAELPGARVARFKRTGHGIPALRPDLFNEVVLRFLADVEDGEPIAGELHV